MRFVCATKLGTGWCDFLGSCWQLFRFVVVFSPSVLPARCRVEPSRTWLCSAPVERCVRTSVWTCACGCVRTSSRGASCCCTKTLWEKIGQQRNSWDMRVTQTAPKTVQIRILCICNILTLCIPWTKTFVHMIPFKKKKLGRLLEDPFVYHNHLKRTYQIFYCQLNRVTIALGFLLAKGVISASVLD